MKLLEKKVRMIRHFILLVNDDGGEEIGGVRLFEESVCYDPAKETVNHIYSANRLACPRGYTEAVGTTKYRRAHTTRLVLI